ncbi:hypothetical protein N1F78_12955 [Seonamhaeicola sp. MEBiC1930]|uniref:hypothetical protein n=1 Tax=Seonamhaeicola sp. MEBiC01930 TaxID=2976768 RepID=UPI00324997B8
MRSFLLLAGILSFSFLQGQPGGGMQGGGMRGSGQGGQMGQQRPEMRVFNAYEIAGIFSYNDIEAIDKLKLNKKKQKALMVSVRRVLLNYNSKIEEIKLINKDNFDTLNIYVNAMMKARMSSRRQGRGNQEMGGFGEDDIMEDDSRERRRGEGADGRDGMRHQIREKIEPVKRAVEEEEIKLNKKLEEVLDEKKYKKWLKYQKKIKEELNPKPESNNQQRGQMSGGMRGGQGGRGGGIGMR